MAGRLMRATAGVVKNLLVLPKQEVTLTQLNSQRLHLQNVRSANPVVAHGGPVVSITTYGAKLKTVYLVLESIASGSLLPSQLILWVRYNRDRRAYPAISLSAHGGDLTAIGNDYSFADLFARQVQAYGGPGDVLALFTTSGNSENVLRALVAAKDLGMKNDCLPRARRRRVQGACRC
jgi:phosphoheptose isomerase